MWAKFIPSPPGGPTGKYQFTPNQTYALYPQLATSRPFLVKSVKPYDKYGGPYPIPSAQYNTEYDELATIGNANSSKNTPAFKKTALFWEAGASTNFALSAHQFPAIHSSFFLKRNSRPAVLALLQVVSRAFNRTEINHSLELA